MYLKHVNCQPLFGYVYFEHTTRLTREAWKMKVDIWFDYACPFCYIGKRSLEAAINEFIHKDQIDIQYHSYQLQPDAPKNSGSNIHELIAGKYGTTVEHAKKMNEHISEQAREVGLTFRFDTMIPTNTGDAHRLTHYAKKQGKNHELTEQIFNAYFTVSLHIGDETTLLKLANEIGLPEKEVMDVLKTGKYKKELDHDIQTGVQIGIQGVPFFVFNHKYAISGAQSAETFKEVLMDVWEEEYNGTLLALKKQTKSEFCTGESCDTP